VLFVAKKMTERKNAVVAMIKTGGKMPPVHKLIMGMFAILCKEWYNIYIKIFLLLEVNHVYNYHF